MILLCVLQNHLKIVSQGNVLFILLISRRIPCTFIDLGMEDILVGQIFRVHEFALRNCSTMVSENNYKYRGCLPCARLDSYRKEKGKVEDINGT